MGSAPSWGQDWHQNTNSTKAIHKRTRLVGHHWEERPLGLAKIICPSTGECQGQEARVCGLESRAGKGIGDFQDSVEM